MIVTCPECSTGYHVEPAALGGGRMVRCTKCAHTWMMVPPDASDDVAAALSAAREPALSAMAPAAAAGARATGRGLAWVLWVVLVVAVAGLIGGGVVWRDDVVRLWPPAQAVYRLAGLKTVPAGVGLAVRNITWKAVRRGGITVLAVTGEVSNMSSSVREVPQMRGHLFDDKDRELQRWTFAAPEGRLLPGENVVFSTELENPAAGATRLIIVFDDGRT